jgi:outer membrane protein assembly factor BamB
MVAMLGGCAAMLAAGGGLHGIFDADFDLGLGENSFACLGAGIGPGGVSVVDTGPGGVAPRWDTRLPATSTSPPATAGALAYVRTRSGVVALDANTGGIVWDARLAGRPALGIDFAPVVDGGSVYVTGWDGVVHALDAATGVPRWSTPLPTAPVTTTTVARDAPSAPEAFLGLPNGGAPLAVDADSVYVGGADLVALDRASGAVRWLAPVGNSPFHGYSSPVVRDGAVVVGAGAGDVRAFDAGTGALRWSTTLGAGDGSALAVASPRVAVAPAGLVVTGGEADTVHVVDADTGTVLRSVTSGELGSFGSVVGVAGDVVYVRADTLQTLDPTTGTIVGEAKTLGATDFDFNPPTVTDALVITPGGDGRLHAFGRVDGREQWAIGRYRQGRCRQNSAALPPAMTDTTMVVVSGGRHVVAFDRTDVE